MALNLQKITGSRLCVSVTGVAGPESEGDFKPGTYCISVIFDGQQTTKMFYHNGRTRQMNREFMMLTMYDMVIRIIDGTELIDVW